MKNNLCVLEALAFCAALAASGGTGNWWTFAVIGAVFALYLTCFTIGKVYK